MDDTLQLLLGLLLGIIIAAIAWRARSLKLSGAVAAAISGGLVFGLGGLPWAALLLAFFISSSALSQIFSRRKAAIDAKYAKGSQRDWGQVLANGGLGAALAVLYGIYPQYSWLWIAFAGAMAAVNADTWATELGFFSPIPPRLITNSRKVESGTSGGVTPLGYLAALCGSALIAVIAVLFTPTGQPLALAAIVTLAGVGGATFDSLLGATVQAIYYCPTCQKETERHPTHTCGSPTVHKRGWRWLQNDWVNFLCSLAGALLAAGLYYLFLQ
jgi:uncharacterized protein (TIGR00297 family)